MCIARVPEPFERGLRLSDGREFSLRPLNTISSFCCAMMLAAPRNTKSALDRDSALPIGLSAGIAPGANQLVR